MKNLCRRRWDLRSLNVLNSFLFRENPRRPTLASIGHAAEDDLGNLETRIAQPHCRGVMNGIEQDLVADANHIPY